MRLADELPVMGGRPRLCSMREIYLDNNATTLLAPEVRAAMEPFFDSCYGNPSSVHRKGVEAAQALDVARERIRAALGGGPFDIVFTSGGTEANNLAIKGVQRARPGSRRHFLASTVEHASVLEALKEIAERGCDVTLLSVDSAGRIELEELWSALRPDSVMLSLIHVNNEVGTIQDVESIAREAKRRCPRLLIHVDGVQAVGKIALRLEHVDLYSGSAHKLHGPKGSGFLALRRGLALKPVLCGGGHEGGMRSGTQNVAGAVGLGIAVELASAGQERAVRELGPLRDRLRAAVGGELDGRLNSPADGVPHTTNISFAGIPGEVMLRALEERGVFVSTASACTTRKKARSHVLAAMGVPEDVAGSAIRVSFSRYTAADEVEVLLEALRAIRRDLLVPARN
jgi:cysteine desulfurase